MNMASRFELDSPFDSNHQIIKKPRNYKENFEDDKYWNVRMPDGSIGFEQGITLEDATQRGISGHRVIEGLAWDIEAKTNEEIAKVRAAIGEAGLTGAIGSPVVYTPQDAALRTQYPNTIGGANMDFYVRLSSADDIIAIADALRSTETEQ